MYLFKINFIMEMSAQLFCMESRFKTHFKSFLTIGVNQFFFKRVSKYDGAIDDKVFLYTGLRMTLKFVFLVHYCPIVIIILCTSTAESPR